MKHGKTIRDAAFGLFGAVSVLFLIFFIYIGLSENISVYNARDSHSYTEVTGFTAEQAADGTAPAGIRSVYRWTLDDSVGAESHLCFYLVHHYAQVYLEDELIYSLTAQSGNRIGASISSNWVAVPIYPEDAGKELSVVLTPLFESVVGDEPQFLFGSYFSIMFDQLIRDLPQFFISTLCIFVGLFIIAVQLYFSVRTKVPPWDMLFVGSFSILLGLWRITDTRSSPLLFSANPMVLGYITIGALFLCSIPLLLLVSTYFRNKSALLLWSLSAAGSAAAASVLLLQVLGAADFKESLTVSHVMLIIAVSVIMVMVLFCGKSAGHPNRSRKMLLLPGAGILVDLVIFYASGSSSDIFFTLVAFMMYSLVVFIFNILETTRNAYTDSRTGLTNRSRWNELMNAANPSDKDTAMMMLDLNALKQVNDTFGHDAGDKLILSFADILRRALPKDSVICRWGGDEFAVMLTDTGRENVEKYMDIIRRMVDAYNADNEDLPIFYAIGCALSAEHPGLTRAELLGKADDQMYLNKRNWYSERQNTAEK